MLKYQVSHTLRSTFTCCLIRVGHFDLVGRRVWALVRTLDRTHQKSTCKILLLLSARLYCNHFLGTTRLN